MEIRLETGDRRACLELLLLADEELPMLERYLDRGDMFLLEEGDEVRGECIVTPEGDGLYEIKNIAVAPAFQKRGYGRALIEFCMRRYPDCRTMLVGTGDVPSTLAFYRKCGFAVSHRVPNFFTDNYAHPMFENGRQLVDMVYLRRDRCPS